MKVLIINGPNLNMLPLREDAYGKISLEEIIQFTEEQLQRRGRVVEIDWFQSNIEGEIISKIHTFAHYDLLIINPAGYSHTSVAILDALKIVSICKIEVHLTNTLARELFRREMLTAQGVDIVMEGLGKRSYLMAIESQL